MESEQTGQNSANEQKPVNPQVPAHLLKRRRQQYQLRRRRFSLGRAEHELLSAVPSGAEGEVVEPPPSDPPPAARSAAVDDAISKARIAELEKNEAESAKKLEQFEKELEVKEKRIAELEARATRLQSDVQVSQKARDDAKRVVEQAKERIAQAQQETENIRKRSEREKDEMRKLAAESLLNQLFLVLDHFSVAMESIKGSQDPDSIIKGVTMIYREFSETLAQNGLVPLSPLGEPFDPKLHDAVSTVEDPIQPDGIVVQVMRQGYTLHDKILRPAMVAVNKIPEEGGVKEGTGVGGGKGKRRTIKREAEPIDEAFKYLESRFDE